MNQSGRNTKSGMQKTQQVTMGANKSGVFLSTKFMQQRTQRGSAIPSGGRNFSNTEGTRLSMDSRGNLQPYTVSHPITQGLNSSQPRQQEQINLATSNRNSRLPSPGSDQSSLKPPMALFGGRVQTASTNYRLQNKISESIHVSKNMRQPWKDATCRLHPDIVMEQQCNESIFKTSQACFNRNDLLQFEMEGLNTPRENTILDTPGAANSPLRRRLQDVAMGPPINNWNSPDDVNFLDLPKEKWVHPQKILNQRLSAQAAGGRSRRRPYIGRLSLEEEADKYQNSDPEINEKINSAKIFAKQLYPDIPLQRVSLQQDEQSPLKSDMLYTADEAVTMMNDQKAKALARQGEPKFLTEFREAQVKKDRIRAAMRPPATGKGLHAQQLLKSVALEFEAELTQTRKKQTKLLHQALNGMEDDVEELDWYSEGSEEQLEPEIVVEVDRSVSKGSKRSLLSPNNGTNKNLLAPPGQIQKNKQPSMFSVTSGHSRMSQFTYGTQASKEIPLTNKQIADQKRQENRKTVQQLRHSIQGNRMRMQALRQSSDESFAFRKLPKKEEKQIHIKKLQGNMAQIKNIEIDDNGRNILAGILKEENTQDWYHENTDSSSCLQDSAFESQQEKDDLNCMNKFTSNMSYVSDKKELKKQRGRDRTLSGANEIEENQQDVKQDRKHTVFFAASKKMSFYSAVKKQNHNTADKQKDRTHSFLKHCLQQNITPCPLACKIDQNFLSLLSYPISKQMAEVLGQNLQFWKHQQEGCEALERLWLADNHLKDDGFAEIMKGLLEVGQLKHITYADNEFGEQSVKYVSKFLERAKQIDRLVISNVTTQPKFIARIFNAANDRHYIQKIRISGVSLPDRAVFKMPEPEEPETIHEFVLYDELISHLTESKALRHLDLSHCNLSGKLLTAIPQSFIDNIFCKIKRLDLSGNRLTHSKAGKAGQKKTQSDCDDFLHKLAEFINLDSEPSTVRYAKRLTTLNLSGMNLQDSVMILAEPVKNSKSLCSLQITDNNMQVETVTEFCTMLGINRDFTEKVCNKRLKIRMNMPIVKEMVQQYDENMTQKVRLMNNNLMQKEIESKKRLKVDEFQGLRHSSGPVTEVGVNAARYAKAPVPIIFQRTCGQHELQQPFIAYSDIHQHEFTPNVQKWKFSVDGKCSIQNHHNYVLFFFQRSRINKQFQKVSDKKQIELIKTQLFTDHVYDFESERKENPLICGSFTGWETIQMRHVSNSMSKKTPEYKKCVGEITEMATKLITDNKLDKLVDKIHSGEGIGMLKQYTNDIENFNWRQTINKVFSHYHGPDFCLFNYPPYTGAEDQYRKEIDEDVFVFAGYAAAGRHQVFIKDPVTDTIYVQHLIVHMKDEEVKAVPLDEDFNTMQKLQMTTRTSHAKHRIFRNTELFKVDKRDKNNLFPKVNQHEKKKKLEYDLKVKISQWCAKMGVGNPAANNDLVDPTSRPSTVGDIPKPKESAHIMVPQTQEGKDFFKMVKQMFKSVSKILKLRMRSGTFPNLCMSDLARVMRDLGLIDTIKGGAKKVKQVWFKARAECSEEKPPNADEEHPCKIDHIKMLLTVFQEFANHVYLDQAPHEANSPAEALKLMNERNIEPFFMQLKWLQKRKTVIWQTPVNEIVHMNIAWLRALYNKFSCTQEENLQTKLLSIAAGEKIISTCEELCDATRFLVRTTFRESVMTPALQPVIGQSEKAKMEMVAIAEAAASSGSVDVDNTASNQDCASPDVVSPIYREKDPQPLCFVEFVEFLLRLFQRMFGDNTHPMHNQSYAGQVAYGMDIVSEAFDSELCPEQKAKDLTITEEGILKEQKICLEDEILVQMMETGENEEDFAWCEK